MIEIVAVSSDILSDDFRKRGVSVARSVQDQGPRPLAPSCAEQPDAEMKSKLHWVFKRHMPPAAISKRER